jgi:hypothetical protein
LRGSLNQTTKLMYQTPTSKITWSASGLLILPTQGDLWLARAEAEAKEAEAKAEAKEAEGKAEAEAKTA